MRVFFAGAGSGLAYADGAGGAWQAPVGLGGALASAPAAVRLDDARQRVFYVGASGHLFESALDTGAWSAAQDLGVAAASAPAAVVPLGEPDRLEVFFAGRNGDLTTISFDPLAGWSAPRDLGLATATTPTAASFARGRVDLFYGAPGGTLAHAVLRGGGVAAVESDGLALASGPAARDEAEVYFRAPNGHLARGRAPQPIAYPRLDQVWGMASHNAYWMDRDHWNPEFFATGVEELILDQLLHEHVRSLEIDLHTDDGNPGSWTIYHTNRPEFSSVHTLADACEMLRVFHHALPEHEVVNLVLEIKNTNLDPADLPATEHNFLPTHTIADLDATLRRAFGDALYTPAELLARAAPGSTLARAAAVAGWPTTDRLRGRFMVNILGWWSNAAYDWARYGGEPPGIAARACFPLRSIFDAQGDGTTAQWPGSAVDPVPPAWLQAARDASVFWDVLDFSFPAVPGFLAAHGIARAGDAFDFPDQAAEIARGATIIATDYPWHAIEDGGPPGAGIPTDPSRRFRDLAAVTGGASIDPRALVEPGLRIYASSGDAQRKLAYARAPAGGVRFWETTVSTTRVGDTWGTNYPRRAQEGGAGGLAAAAGRGDSLEVLRVKTGRACGCADQEQLSVHVEIAHGGVARGVDFPASPFGTDAVGSMLALEIDETGALPVVRAFSAGRLDASGAPAWQLLVEETFAAPLIFQGLVFTEDVLFVGTKVREGAGAARAATLCDLASIDGGPATLVDLSSPAPAATCAPVPAPLP